MNRSKFNQLCLGKTLCMKHFILIVLFTFISYCFYSQTKSDSKAIDTVKNGNFAVVLFENQTWEYINHDSIIALKKHLDSVNFHNYICTSRLIKHDSLTVFSEKWDTINIFAYGGINYDRAQDSLALVLIDETRNFAIPDTGFVLGGFGWRRGRRHNAVDINLNTGDTVVSAFDGIVRYAGWNSGGYGYLVIVRHYNGLETYYAHLSKLKCSFNQPVKAGELIGLGGSTGRSYGPHLHFETRYKDNPLDPSLIFDFENKKLKNDTLVLVPEIFSYIGKNSSCNYTYATSTSQKSTDGIHYVCSGDSLWAISRRYGVSIQTLCSINSITENTTLQIGQKIRTH